CWVALTLLCLLTIVCLIVRRTPAVALLLASPFTLWNCYNGQCGFLTASLLGGALYFIERRPLVAGALIGCLTYKPHFGILIPFALAAAKQWRVMASAALTTLALVTMSIAAFGSEPWLEFPHALYE